MAGSLRHVVAEDGGFRFNLIENLGDAHEACEEMFDLIAYLVGDNPVKLAAACQAVGAPIPTEMPICGKRSDPYAF